MMGACTNAADTAIMKMPSFQQSVNDCATKNIGNAGNTSNCVQMATGLSAACSGCQGDLAVCGFNNCIAMCIDQSTPDKMQACNMCLATNCGAAYQTCSGVALQ
jgi:hypothetical protein